MINNSVIKNPNSIFGMLLILSFLFIASCDNTEPSASFDEPFPKRKKNLWWKLGDQFSLLKYGDTVTLTLDFDNDTRTNYLIEKQTGDTVFAGTVSKYRGLYFLNHQTNDTSYWISAVDINKNISSTHNTITGLGTAEVQMEFLIKAIRKGKYQDLVTYTNQDSSVIYLHPDKETLYGFYASLLDTIPADTMVYLPGEKITPSDSTGIGIADVEKSSGEFDEYQDFEENFMIKNLYPNPAQDFCFLETYDAVEYMYDLTDASGTLYQRDRIVNGKVRIDLSEMEPGVYFIRVYPENKSSYETVKLIVA
ncbi:MAG: T9SS type A sorting domain-containing protein [Candidatus Delongbacteria bacterium]|jgi:hypothetical protein|nr:T9SS type A sorting domain-containing protein [Candidatus Delongbacteria bacterium]